MSHTLPQHMHGAHIQLHVLMAIFGGPSVHACGIQMRMGLGEERGRGAVL